MIPTKSEVSDVADVETKGIVVSRPPGMNPMEPGMIGVAGRRTGTVVGCVARSSLTDGDSIDGTTTEGPDELIWLSGLVVDGLAGRLPGVVTVDMTVGPLSSELVIAEVPDTTIAEVLRVTRSEDATIAVTGVLELGRILFGPTGVLESAKMKFGDKVADIVLPMILGVVILATSVGVVILATKVVLG